MPLAVLVGSVFAPIEEEGATNLQTKRNILYNRRRYVMQQRHLVTKKDEVESMANDGRMLCLWVEGEQVRAGEIQNNAATASLA